MSTHETPTLQGQVRDITGSRYAKRIREAGQLPCVIYGHGEAPEHIAMDAKRTQEVLLEHAHLVNIAIQDANGQAKTESCVVKEVQWDHLGRKMIHIDWTRVDLSEEIELEIEMAFHGDPKAAHVEGHVLDQPLSSLLIRCRADSIPEVIDVDVSQLTDEAPLTAGELTLPEGVTLAADPETVVAQITTVRVKVDLDELESGGEEEAGEPEVIGEKKEDQEPQGDE